MYVEKIKWNTQVQNKYIHSNLPLTKFPSTSVPLYEYITVSYNEYYIRLIELYFEYIPSKKSILC